MMRSLAILGAAAALLSGPAVAYPGRTTTSLCLDPGGHPLPVTCHIGQASRVEHQEDICQCLNGGMQVTVPLCPRGVTPPPESAAYERARYGLVQHGSLVGATWQGRPVCVAGTDALSGR
jgi:hypothetical protein